MVYVGIEICLDGDWDMLLVELEYDGFRIGIKWNRDLDMLGLGLG
jgi:hypothetical protein